MKRRGFIKLLGLVTAAASVPITLLSKPKDKYQILHDPANGYSVGTWSPNGASYIEFEVPLHTSMWETKVTNEEHLLNK